MLKDSIVAVLLRPMPADDAGALIPGTIPASSLTVKTFSYDAS
jgi:hypothetical protein